MNGVTRFRLQVRILYVAPDDLHPLFADIAQLEKAERENRLS
jgi:hypothetical protein